MMAFSAAVRGAASATAAIRALGSSAPLVLRDPSLASSQLPRFSSSSIHYYSTSTWMSAQSSAPLVPAAIRALRSSAPLVLRDPPRLASSHLTRFSSSHYYSTSTTWMRAQSNKLRSWLTNPLENMLMKMIVGDDKWITFFRITIHGIVFKASTRIDEEPQQPSKKIDSEDNFSLPVKFVFKKGDTSMDCNLAISPKEVVFLGISLNEGTNNEDRELFIRFAVKVVKSLKEYAEKNLAGGTSSEDREYFKNLNGNLEKALEYLHKNQDTK